MAAETVDARTLLGEAAAARRRTRRARQGFWFPLVVLGLVVLGSTPLYFGPSTLAAGGLRAAVAFEASGSVGYFPAGAFTASPWAIALFWLTTLPGAYLVISGWYLLRARRRGVATSPWPYVGLGLLLLAVLVVTSPQVVLLAHLPRAVAFISSTSDFSVRGLTPLLSIAVGLVALAVIERSRALGAYVAALFGLVLVADLYDLANLTGRLSLGPRGPEINVVLAGVFLLSGGVGFGLTRLRSSG